MNIPFLDLNAQYSEIQKAASLRLKQLMKNCDFILGREVQDFEKNFSAYVGTRFALGVNSGTDALFLALLSLKIGPGDEVIVPGFTYIASAFAVSYVGAKPVFADIDEETYNINPYKIEKLITRRTKAIMPVHLYGQAADMAPILKIANKHNLLVVEDSAQAHGAKYRGKMTGNLGDIGCFSFYPTKNLGALGDAGMVTTNSRKIYESLKKLRDYGRKSRYEHVSLGYNTRLDSIQALFLNLKLSKLDKWNYKRIAAAKHYFKHLYECKDIILPKQIEDSKHVYHIFAVKIKNRDRIIEKLKTYGIGAAVHYPVPLHLQKVYKYLGYRIGDLPIAEQVSKNILCLPIYPHIRISDIEYICKTLKGLIKHE